MNNFDLAAAKAEKELRKLSDMTATEVAKWFADFYMTAGHKRLGRILVKRSKLAA